MLITNNQEGWKPAIIVFNILMKMNNRTMERKGSETQIELHKGFDTIVFRPEFQASVPLTLKNTYSCSINIYECLSIMLQFNNSHWLQGVRKSYWNAIKNETEKFFKVRPCLEGVRCYAWSFDHLVPDPSSVPSH